MPGYCIGGTQVSFILGRKIVHTLNRSSAAIIYEPSEVGNDRVSQWIMPLRGYDYWVQDIPSKDNILANCKVQ